MKLTTGFTLTIAITLSACASTPPAPIPVDPNAARAASPASLNCIQNHGKLEIRQTPEGEKADCLLPSGKRCDEWEMFRGNCPTRTVNANGIFGF
jgi:putative hemolysin